jgi:hypothetical protein
MRRKYIEDIEGTPGVIRPATAPSAEAVYDEVLASSRFFPPGGHSSKPSCMYDARKLLADCTLPERLLAAELPMRLACNVDFRSLRDLLIAQPDLLEEGIVPRV